VECRLKASSTVRYSDMGGHVVEFLRQRVQVLDNSAITHFAPEKVMEENVDLLRISATDGSGPPFRS